jgi:hypothetical protein
VEELFEARQRPKGEAVITEIGGRADIRVIDGVRHVFVTDVRLVDDIYEITDGWDVKVGHNDAIEAGGVLAENEDEVVVARHGGRLTRTR